MPLLYISQGYSRKGLYFTSVLGVGDPGYKPPVMPIGGVSSHAEPLPPNQALVFGGADGTGVRSDTRHFTYPSSWMLKTAMPAARRNFTGGTLPDGRILLCGGKSPDYGVEAVNTAYIYNPASGTWVSAPAMPAAKKDHLGVRLENGKIYVAGGADNANNVVATAYIFDPSTMTWAAVANLPEGRQAAASGPLPGGKAAIAGGVGASSATTSVYIYNAASNSYSVGASMPQARYYARGLWMDTIRRLIVVGSNPSNTNAPTLNQQYDPSNNTWQLEANAPIPATDMSGAVIGEMAFFFGIGSSFKGVLVYWA